MTLADLGKTKEAHRIYQVIAEENPSFYEARINDAILHYRDMQKPAVAAEMFKKILAKDLIDRQDRYFLTRVWAHYGAALLGSGDFKSAEQAFLNALDISKEKNELLGFAGKEYRKIKRAKDFLKLLQKTVDRPRPNGFMYALLGEVQSEDLNLLRMQSCWNQHGVNSITGWA